MMLRATIFFFAGVVTLLSSAKTPYAIPATRAELRQVESHLNQTHSDLSLRTTGIAHKLAGVDQEIEGVRATLAYAAAAMTNLAAIIATIRPLDPTTDEARQFADAVSQLAAAYQLHAQDIVQQRVDATNAIACIRAQVEANMWHGVSDVSWPLQNRTTHVLKEVPSGYWIDPTQLNFSYQTLALISHTNTCNVSIPASVRVYSEDDLVLPPGVHFVSILGLDRETVFLQIREASKWERKQ